VRQRRAELARSAVVQRLQTVLQLPPEESERLCEQLARRVGDDPDLAELHGPVAEGLAAARRGRVEAELAAADVALASGQFGHALRHAVEARKRASSERDRTAADAVAARVAASRGLVAEPVTGQFVFGTPADYSTELNALSGALAERGYILPPDLPAWSAIWRTQAPYRLVLTIRELPDSPVLLSSSGRPCRIAVRLELRHGSQLVWSSSTGETVMPPPATAAVEARPRAASGKTLSPAERRLIDEARDEVRSRLELAARSVPGPLE
jgi:hypothetical protein